MKPHTLTPGQLKWLNEADYESLLARWLFSRPEEDWFTGANDVLYHDKIQERRQALMPFEAERIEKKIGWERGRFWDNIQQGKDNP